LTATPADSSRAKLRPLIAGLLSTKLREYVDPWLGRSWCLLSNIIERRDYWRANPGPAVILESVSR
jgi:hypothetical protein